MCGGLLVAKIGAEGSHHVVRVVLAILRESHVVEVSGSEVGVDSGLGLIEDESRRECGLDADDEVRATDAEEVMSVTR